MNSNAPCPKVINPEYATYNVPSHIVEHQNFPDWVAILVQDGGRNEALCGGIMVAVLGLRLVV